MGLFNGAERRARRDNERLIAALDGRAIRYASERDFDTKEERVLGKNGRINTQNDVITIMCDGREVFRCDAETARCGELMSLNGVVITGISDVTGRETTVVGYYQYYRRT